MLFGSNRFDDAVIYGGDVATRCDVVDNKGQYVVRSLDVLSGSVSVDDSRKTRRQCSLTLQDPTGELVPNTAKDILQPYSGYYLKLYRGFSWSDGEQELMPLGTFAPYAPKIRDSDDSLEITLDGYDRSKIISRLRWTQPYIIAAQTNTAQAIHDLLDNRMPGLRYHLEPTKATVPLTVLGTSTDNDPWDDAQTIASADGMELFFDADDIVTLRTIPDPLSDQEVRTYEDNAECTVTVFDRTNDAEKMYTGVIVYSEGTEIDAPIRVEVWRADTDLRIPYFFPTSLINNVAQATATGESILRRVGFSEFGVQLTIVPDPRADVGDVVRIRRALSKLDDPFVISSMSIPLDAESPMTMSTAMRRMT